jgi:hypothetical protein
MFIYRKAHLETPNTSDPGNLVDLFGDQRKIHYNINKRLAQFMALWYRVEA